MGAEQFCFRACNPAGSNAPGYCQHVYDVMGCGTSTADNPEPCADLRVRRQIGICPQAMPKDLIAARQIVARYLHLHGCSYFRSPIYYNSLWESTEVLRFTKGRLQPRLRILSLRLPLARLSAPLGMDSSSREQASDLRPL
jgi:hypothetical protein